MIQIRTNVYETNSSSTHSFCLCLKSEYDAFERGERYLDTRPIGKKHLVTMDEALNLIKNEYGRYLEKNPIPNSENKDDLETFIDRYGFWNYEKTDKFINEYSDVSDFDCISTPSGEKVVAFWAYLYD